MSEKIRIGVIGAGGIFRRRHLPGLARIDDAEVVAICNRSEESGREIAEAFGLNATVVTDPHALIARDDIDAIMIGTWPYKHCPFVLQALDAGKHTFTQARMSMNLREAKAMYAKARETGLATQVCPSPLGIKGDPTLRRLIREGYLGEVYNISFRSLDSDFCDPESPLHWRQVARYSGLNALAVGMRIEWIHRWFGYAKSLTSQVGTFIKARPLADGRGYGPVERPDTVNVLCQMENGASGAFLFSGVTRHRNEQRVEAYGSDGTLIYDTITSTLWGGRADDTGLSEIPIPEDDARAWRVEQDFIDAIRTGRPAESTFYEGVKYMEFTEAIFRSVETGGRVTLPLVD